MGTENPAPPGPWFFCMPLPGWLPIDHLWRLRPIIVRAWGSLCAAPGGYARMDYLFLVLVLYLFSPWDGRVGSAAVGEASRARVVGEVLLYVGRYSGAGGARWLYNPCILHPTWMISA